MPPKHKKAPAGPGPYVRDRAAAIAMAGGSSEATRRSTAGSEDRAAAMAGGSLEATRSSAAGPSNTGRLDIEEEEERARIIRRLDERAAERAALIRLERERDGFFDSPGNSMLSTPPSSSSSSSYRNICEGPKDPTTGWRPKDFIDTIWRVAYVEYNMGTSWWTLRADSGPADGMEAEVKVIGLIGDEWRPQLP